MTFLIALVALAPVTYRFPVGSVVSYDAQVVYDGFIPLFGGQEGKVEVTMGIEATGLASDAEGNPQVVSELKTLDLLMNGAKFPLGAENAKNYFPKTTISMSPQGRVLKTDAPDIAMVFRLPGLDVKRFPEVSYIPLEFPIGDLEIGKSYAFKRLFGGSEMTYTVTPDRIDDESVHLKVMADQTYETLEDARLEVVTDAKEAVARVATTLKGEGEATFDRTRGIVTFFDVSANAISKVTNLQTKVESERKLKTRLLVKAKPAA